MKMLTAALLSLLALPATAAELSSQYTRLDHARDCVVVDQAAPDEGDWADRQCPGLGEYSYFLRSSDGREAVTYGYADEPGMPTFGRFNYANGTVEWRVGTVKGEQRPLAAIQRWYLADIDGNWTTQILVVSKVGQPEGGGGCVVGYVSANEGASANLRARALSNDVASFRCGRDQPLVEARIRADVPQQ